MGYSYTNWEDRFGDQVSRRREARTGEIALLYHAEIERVPGMTDALLACFAERVTPKLAAQRYIALVDGSKEGTA